jgi:hypothetical protein
MLVALQANIFEDSIENNSGKAVDGKTGSMKCWCPLLTTDLIIHRG